MLILILFAFLAGIVTVLSPCILPILPIVLSGSVDKGKRRPVGIVTGFVLSFTFFTLFLTFLVNQFGISADLLRSVSVLVIFLFGVSLLWPRFQIILEKLFSRFAQYSPSQKGDGFYGGVLLGLSLGLLWTPCVGPILASVIALALTGAVNQSALFITFAYSVGTSLPMLAIIYGGRQLLNRVPWLTRNTGKIQQGFGVVMILTALAIYTNLDRRFQTWVLTAFPNYGTGLTQLENFEAVTKRLKELQIGPVNTNEIGQPLFEMRDTTNYPVAPELLGGTQWLNSEPLLFDGNLKGKVVLIDFWTYSCINCIRTFPHLVDWYAKYKDQGFIIVGVHSPEFEFEKSQANVEQALTDHQLTYPVVMDNDFKIWRAYNNRYWPAHYLVDRDGKVRYTHFGEGKYLETENKIRELLGEETMMASLSADDQTPNRRQTPETYLGYGRAEAYVFDNQLQRDQTASYAFTAPLTEDSVALRGSWRVSEEYVLAGQSEASLSLNFLAQTVHLVMAPETKEGKVQVFLDGQPLPAKYRTKDVSETGFIPITEPRKYDLLDLGSDYGRHTLELRFTEGVSAYAFTFGS